MTERIAIINRGEAALRCLRAIADDRAEGIDAVGLAFYTPVDAGAPFVLAAHEAYELPLHPGASAARSYLDIDSLLAACARARATAVWVGWGFVSESAEFAERVVAAGMRFIGPSAESMRMLGDKIGGKRLAESVGVAVAPWSGGPISEWTDALQVAVRTGYPLLLKASAGGGGRGIRIVRRAEELQEAFAQSSGEALRAFGDGRVFVERCVERARHLEVQLLADRYGAVRCFGVRDCTLQRKHQKVIEEAPGPHTTQALVDALERQSAALALAAGYEGLGTVEFLYDIDRDEAYFMEMNTRLQVEHPITEAIYGVDLVRLQLAIARGERVPSERAQPRGYAIEARLNAEDPARDFAPSCGAVARFNAALGPGVRIDSGVVTGSTIPPDFDSMIAKLIAVGATREQALARLRRAVRETSVLITGGTTNKALLARLLEDPNFQAGAISTRWLDANAQSVLARAHPLQRAAELGAFVFARREVWLADAAQLLAEAARGIPRRTPDASGTEVRLRDDGRALEAKVYSLRFDTNGDEHFLICDGAGAASVVMTADGRLRIAGRLYGVQVAVSAAAVALEVDGEAFCFTRVQDAAVRAPAPALVTSVKVGVGDHVSPGQVVATLEAMKTEMPLRAATGGRVTAITVSAGMQVPSGAVLIELSADQAVDAARGARSASAARVPPSVDDALAELIAVWGGGESDKERLAELARVLASLSPSHVAAVVRSVVALAVPLRHAAGDAAFFARLTAVAKTGAVGTEPQALLRELVRRRRRDGVAQAAQAIVASLLGQLATESACFAEYSESLLPALEVLAALPGLTHAALLARYCVANPAFTVALGQGAAPNGDALTLSAAHVTAPGDAAATETALLDGLRGLAAMARARLLDGARPPLVQLQLSAEPAPLDPMAFARLVADELKGFASITVDVAGAFPRTLRVSNDNGLCLAWRFVDALARALPAGRPGPEQLLRLLVPTSSDSPRPITLAQALPSGHVVELDLIEGAPQPVTRPLGRHSCSVFFGIVSHTTTQHPDGMRRVIIVSDATRDMGALAEPECRRIIAALDVAEELGLPVEWLPVSSGARIAMDSGTENLDWTARVLRRIIAFTAAGGVINIIVDGVNVGAQSYFNAEATMLMHTRGVLIMTPRGAMVLTGKRALDFSGGVSAEDERGIGGYERVMGPNGQAHFVAPDLVHAYALLLRHYEGSYVTPGERGVRPRAVASAHEHNDVPAALFDPVGNAERKRPFDMRALMRTVIDAPGDVLEPMAELQAARSAIVWDCFMGGRAVTLVGFESAPLARTDDVPADGPDQLSGGTLFPLSSKKVARALRAASGVKPVVVLANLSGFDGSPESMRKLQLEYGAEIGRAVVEFDGPIVFCVVGRYHGGAYVVFSRALNPQLRAVAVRGSFASVIGGAPAAAVVFAREVRQAALADPRVAGPAGSAAALPQVLAEKQAALGREFDAIHSVERACRVGSLDGVIEPHALRSELLTALQAAPAATAPATSRRAGDLPDRVGGGRPSTSP